MKNPNHFIFQLVLLLMSLTIAVNGQMQTPWNLKGGEKIFFTKTIGLSTDLYAMNPNGSNVQKLSNFGDGIYVSMPKISANGKYLTFISNYESYKSVYELDVFRLDLLTGELQRLTGDEWKGPMTQNTGTLIVHYQIPTIPATSYGMVSYMGCSNMTQVNYGTEHTFENVPAGKMIWVKAIGESGVGMVQNIIIPPNTVQKIYMDANNGTTGYGNAYPSPDGNEIAATLITNSLGTDLNNSGDNKVLSNINILNSNGALTDAVNSVQCNDGAFSNDGNKLAFSIGLNGSPYESLAYLNTSNYQSVPIIILNGQVSVALNTSTETGYNNPSWSPDGEKIVFFKMIKNQNQFSNTLNCNIYMYNIATSKLSQLTDYSGKRIAMYPCFSPDGNQVVYTDCLSNNNQFNVSDYISGNYSTSIYKINLTTGNTVTLIADGNSADPTWGIVPGGSVGTQTTIMQEGFDNLFPPENWTLKSTNNDTWHSGNITNHNFNEIDPNNSYSAIFPKVQGDHDEELVTPKFALGNGPASLEFYALYNSYDLADMSLFVSTDDGEVWNPKWTLLWESQQDGDSLKWRKITVDLSAYSNNQILYLTWTYMGWSGDAGGIDGIKLTGVSDVTGVNTVNTIPSKFDLSQNYPNPFNPTTTINYEIPKQSIVQLKVYDVLGREVVTLVNEEKQPGKYKVEFDGRRLASGVYFYMLYTKDFIQTRKLILLK